MTAEEARSIMPAPGPRREAVAARLAKFRTDIRDAAKKGLHTLPLANVRKTKMEITEAEEAAVHQQLVAEGYAFDAEAGTISWAEAPPS